MAKQRTRNDRIETRREEAKARAELYNKIPLEQRMAKAGKKEQFKLLDKINKAKNA